MDVHRTWFLFKKNGGHLLGFLPEIIDLSSDQPFVEMVNENYRHGGGWHPFGEGKWKLHQADSSLVYPASDEYPEERYSPIALGFLKTGGCALIYEYALVCWVPDLAHLDKFQVSRMD